MPSSVTHMENLAIIEEICSFFVLENVLQTIITCYQEKFQHACVGPYGFKSFICLFFQLTHTKSLRSFQ